MIPRSFVFEDFCAEALFSLWLQWLGHFWLQDLTRIFKKRYVLELLTTFYDVLGLSGPPFDKLGPEWPSCPTAVFPLGLVRGSAATTLSWHPNLELDDGHMVILLRRIHTADFADYAQSPGSRPKTAQKGSVRRS